MNKLLILSLVALAGCAKGEESKAPADSTARNLTLAPTESSAARSDVPKATSPAAKPAESRPSNPPPPPAPVTHTAAAGSFLDIAVDDTLSSQFTKAGDAFAGTLVDDVKDAKGSVVIPAGSKFRGSVLEVKPSPNQNTPGTLKVSVTSVEVHGKSYPIEARIDSLETTKQGRHITGGDVAKTGAGAAAGAILGRILTKNTAGTVIGGVVGGAIGAGVASATKTSDIVLPKGAHINASLMKPVTVAAK